MIDTIALAKLAEAAVADHQVPGISYAVFSPDQSIQCVIGFQGTGADHIALAPGMYYDLASLTKVVGVTTRYLQLLAAKQLTLETPIGTLVDGLASPELTIGQLLTHRSGLIPDLPDVHRMTQASLCAAVRAAKPQVLPGTVTQYSDLNYILLGWGLATVDGDLATSITQHVTEPLGMNDTSYVPAGVALDEFVPTERVAARGGIVRGVVHDHKAYLLDGVSGHAGLFSTLGDLLAFTRVLAGATTNAAWPNACAALLDHTAIGRRSLGWQRWSDTQPLFWHTGFTGTSIAFDQKAHTGFVCLTNRIYPTRENRGFLAVRQAMLEVFFQQEAYHENR